MCWCENARLFRTAQRLLLLLRSSCFSLEQAVVLLEEEHRQHRRPALNTVLIFDFFFFFRFSEDWLCLHERAYQACRHRCLLQQRQLLLFIR